LWPALWRLSWRWLGLAPIALGIVLAWSAPRPDILVAADGRSIALRQADGRLAFIRPPKDKYAARLWLARDGDLRAAEDVPSIGHCDGVGCAIRIKGMLLAAPLRPEALDEDCRRADVLIAAVAVKDCAGPKLVLDARRIAEGGGYALRLVPKISAASVTAWRGVRPWVHP
jgi:competence protein ComEC